ncbi:hypothetical protein M9H77_31826 [Catharanthus roseus]|uniref:Uncharacterized protein n=1 Tax=Catharanthus roseus TaxID=4058 RepID=A0ACC0A1K1_CATRO|nr:hypothetical protein M9H77_31826 [Catharanthus roseus]
MRTHAGPQQINEWPPNTEQQKSTPAPKPQPWSNERKIRKLKRQTQPKQLKNSILSKKNYKPSRYPTNQHPTTILPPLRTGKELRLESGKPMKGTITLMRGRKEKARKP